MRTERKKLAGASTAGILKGSTGIPLALNPTGAIHPRPMTVGMMRRLRMRMMTTEVLTRIYLLVCITQVGVVIVERVRHVRAPALTSTMRRTITIPINRIQRPFLRHLFCHKWKTENSQVGSLKGKEMLISHDGKEEMVDLVVSSGKVVVVISSAKVVMADLVVSSGKPETAGLLISSGKVDKLGPVVSNGKMDLVISSGKARITWLTISNGKVETASLVVSSGKVGTVEPMVSNCMVETVDLMVIRIKGMVDLIDLIDLVEIVAQLVSNGRVDLVVRAGRVEGLILTRPLMEMPMHLRIVVLIKIGRSQGTLRDLFRTIIVEILMLGLMETMMTTLLD